MLSNCGICVLDKDVRQIIYEYSGNETKQNLLLCFGEWYISSNIIVKNLSNIIKQTHNKITLNMPSRYLHPFKDISHVNSNQLETMVYLLQNPMFEHNLIQLKNIYYNKDQTLYKYHNELLNTYEMLKLLNPLFNSIEIKNKT